MASTTFTDGSSVIFSSWLNDVNTAVYNGVFPNGGLSLINLSVSGTVSGTGFINLVNNTLSAPGPIGSATPNTGAFTSLTGNSLALSGTITAVSPNSGTNGALVVKSNSTGGNGVVQFTNNAGSVQYGAISASPSGVVNVNATGGFRINGNQLGLGITGEVWNYPGNLLGITYTNSRGYPIMVCVTGQKATSSTGDYILSVYVNGQPLLNNGSPTASFGTPEPSVSFIVPPYQTYSVSSVGSGTTNLLNWAELY
jgi:hypothetical protein